MKKHIAIRYAASAIFLLVMSSPASAFFAKVQTFGGAPIAGASVTFAGFDSTVYSDANGVVSFFHVSPVMRSRAAAKAASLRLSSRILRVSLPQAGIVDIRLYSLSGQQIVKFDKTLPPGMHSVNLPVLARGVYILRAGLGSSSFVRKVNFMADFNWRETPRAAMAMGKPSKRTLRCDTAYFAKSGYAPVRRLFGTYGDNLGDVFMDSIVNPLVKAVSAGSNHTMILKQDNTLWAAGYNNHGQLGTGDTIRRWAPAIVLDGVSSVSAGNDFTVVVKLDGSLRVLGNNSCGQIGAETNDSVTMVSAGYCHTMIIKRDHTLWAVGDNSSGQLGTGTISKTEKPVKIMDGVLSVSAGYFHTMIIKQDGTLWATGANGSGQLGDGTTDGKNSPERIMSDAAAVSAGGWHTMILKKDGTLWAVGQNMRGQLGSATGGASGTPQQIMSDVGAVSAGNYHTMILKLDGTLWATGQNDLGQLGDGTTVNQYTPKQIMSDVAAVSAGGLHTMIIKKDGTLWAAGSNNYGQLGDESGAVTSVPRKILPRQFNGLTVSGGTGSGTYLAGRSVGIAAFDSTAARRGFDHWGGSDSTLINGFLKPTATITMPDRPAMVKAVFGDLHNLSVDGGTGSVSSIPGIAVMIRANDSSAIKKVFDHWGGPDSSLTANDTSPSTFFMMPSRDASVKAIYNRGCLVYFDKNGGEDDPFPKQSSLISAGRRYSSSLPLSPRRSGYWFFAWNRNADGSGTTFSDTSIMTADMTVYAQWTRIAAVAAGAYHSMVIAENGTVWAFGWNPYGELVTGDTIGRLHPVQVMNDVSTVSLGLWNTMVLKRDNSLWAIGYNQYGQLGTGDTLAKRIQLQIMTGVLSVSADAHTAVLKKDGTFWTMGAGFYGQLGIGDSTNRKSPVQIMSGVIAGSAGGDNTMIVKQDSTLWVTGNNKYGQLGIGDSLKRRIPVQATAGVRAASAGAWHMMILKNDNTLWATGYNFYGQLGLGDTVNRTSPVQVMSGVSAVSTGSCHTMILKLDNTLWATGWNMDGQLGDGSKIRRLAPVQVASNVALVCAKGNHTLFLKQDGTVWANGDNAYGQGGDGTITDILTPVQIYPMQ